MLRSCLSFIALSILVSTLANCEQISKQDAVTSADVKIGNVPLPKHISSVWTEKIIHLHATKKCKIPNIYLFILDIYFYISIFNINENYF
jgi:hypothetical protein